MDFHWYLILVLFPVYCLACIGLVHLPVFDEMREIAVYIVSLVLAIVVFGLYVRIAGFSKDWFLAGLFGGIFAALLSTMFAIEIRTRSLWKLPRGILPPPDYPANDYGKWRP